MAFSETLAYLKLCGLPAIERVDDSGYTRGLTTPYGAAAFTVSLNPKGSVSARLRLKDARALPVTISRIRWLRDLDADLEAVWAASHEAVDLSGRELGFGTQHQRADSAPTAR